VIRENLEFVYSSLEGYEKLIDMDPATVHQGIQIFRAVMKPGKTLEMRSLLDSIRDQGKPYIEEIAAVHFMMAGHDLGAVHGNHRVSGRWLNGGIGGAERLEGSGDRPEDQLAGVDHALVESAGIAGGLLEHRHGGAKRALL